MHKDDHLCCPENGRLCFCLNFSVDFIQMSECRESRHTTRCRFELHCSGRRFIVFLAFPRGCCHANLQNQLRHDSQRAPKSGGDVSLLSAHKEICPPLRQCAKTSLFPKNKETWESQKSNQPKVWWIKNANNRLALQQKILILQYFVNLNYFKDKCLSESQTNCIIDLTRLCFCFFCPFNWI